MLHDMMCTYTPPPKGGGFPVCTASRKPPVSYPPTKVGGFVQRTKGSLTCQRASLFEHKRRLPQVKCIIFDLDNTLYDEKIYFYSAFNDIGDYAEKHKICRKRAISSSLRKVYASKGSLHRKLINDALLQIGVKDDEKLVKKLVEIFHNTRPAIKPYSDVSSTLKYLKNRVKLALITNGWKNEQKKKLRLLGLNDVFHYSLFCIGKDSKPSSKPFMDVIRHFNIFPTEALYVADNPLIDFHGPKKTGMKTARILKGEFAGYDDIINVDLKIRKIKELKSVIR